MDGYGSCVLRRDGDRLIVERADRTIGVSAELLCAEAGSATADAVGRGITTDAAGCLVIAGQVRYCPIRFDAGGRVVVCERVDS